MKYLLDSNTFIQAKNSYYDMNVCPGYWDWILHQNDREEVGSIDFVRKELMGHKDELSDWAHENQKIFISDSDAPTQRAFAQVANYCSTAPNMKKGADHEFLQGADPWLIAKAMVNGAIVVTLESFNPHNRKEFKIPNVCNHFNVPCLSTFTLLNQLQAKFILETNS